MNTLGNEIGIDENPRPDDAAHHRHRRAKESELPGELALATGSIIRIHSVRHAKATVTIPGIVANRSPSTHSDCNRDCMLGANSLMN